MSLSAKEINRRTLRQVYRLIDRHSKANGKWSQSWKRSELIAEGYSSLVVNKAEQYDRRESLKYSAFQAVMWIPLSLIMAGYMRWFAVFFLGTFVLELVRYFKCRLSPEENARVYEELTQKLGEYQEVWDERPLIKPGKEKRALLWRLDAFLSGKRVSG